nr:TatD family hydrolase [Colwellia sp. C1TZA3]
MVEVAKHLASIRGTSVTEIAQQSSENFHRLFLQSHIR